MSNLLDNASKYTPDGGSIEAVVRELVEGHGGTVVASSEGTGGGSRFVVTLPLIGR